MGIVMKIFLRAKHLAAVAENLDDRGVSLFKELACNRGYSINEMTVQSNPVEYRQTVRFAELQEMLYANSRAGDHRSVLLVLQGMDTAGKGGIVKHVVGGANPQGIDYKSFGKPTPEELSHHYLWRIRKALPAAGHIGVFDRSHYEDVLIVRVHNLVPRDVWEPRYDEINAFERELVDVVLERVRGARRSGRIVGKRRVAF